MCVLVYTCVCTRVRGNVCVYVRVDGSSGAVKAQCVVWREGPRPRRFHLPFKLRRVTKSLPLCPPLGPIANRDLGPSDVPPQDRPCPQTRVDGTSPLVDGPGVVEEEWDGGRTLLE